ncbi:MAG: amino acid ABC transporter ATP-binding protein [Eubacterium sp.]|nr:amino acid ABC transporter ATP-binding protein [Eubacterium sp.]MBR6173649.1 amino acid ABC transporter ATP-binding protein [Eubacterium sp.]
MIELKHLEKRYENSTPLKDVNAVINDGDVISVIGPSGAGKSTLIRCINMLERPTGGQILLDGEDITAHGYDLTRARRKMGMVFQSFNLFGHLTVIENLMLAQVDILKRSNQEAYDTGIELLKRVGLSGRESQYPDELSGGQKQRVAIARTLAMDPDVILLDEPTSALDPTMVGEVQAVIRDLSRTGKTMMIVTHEMSFARAICNRVFYVDEGGIYEDGTPKQIFDHPEKELTRRFIRRLKVLEFNIEGVKFDFPRATAEIDTFCFRNDVPPRIKQRIHLTFEELLQQILLPVLPDPKLRLTIEYAKSEKRVEIRTLYNGDIFDPANTENQLSYTVLQGAAAELIHSAEKEGDFTNTFICRITE